MNSECPQCSQPLAADAPLGLCPGCLLRQGLGQFVDRSPGDEPAATASSNHKFIAPSPDELGERFPELKILELLGQGGFGAVYKVRQKTLDRVVALKLLSPEAAKDAAFAERFTREARAMAKLMHPNIVLVFEFGERDGWYYLLMEFVEGVNLREAMQAEQISAEQSLAIVPQICDALEYAHGEGVVHRDIKPENILVDKKGRIKIADFGLAKLVGRSPIEITLTATHQVMGTLHYMAPEQIDKPLSVDHRADIYSLGVVFYELLTGELPLGRFKLPSEKARVDVRLDDVVLKTLEREPNDRYQNALHVKTDVETISKSNDRPKNASNEKSKRDATRTEESNNEIDEALDLIHGPALATIILGGLNIASFPLVAVIIIALVGSGAIYDDYLMGIAVCIPAVVIGVIMVIGGLSMRQLGSFELSAIAATVSFIPLSPLCFFTIPLGIWSWLVLVKPPIWNSFGNPKRKQYIQQRLRQQSDDGSETAVVKNQLAGLGLTQIIVGISNIVLPFLVGAIVALIMIDDRDFYGVVPAVMICLTPCLPLGVMMLLGGLNLRSRESHAMAMIGGSAAVIPLSPLWLVSLAVGIWSIMVLREPQTRKLFGKRDSETDDGVATTDRSVSRDVYQRAKDQTASIATAHFVFGLLNSLLWVVAILAIAINEASGKVYQYTQGGRSWSIYRTPLDNDLYLIFIAAGICAFAIGILMMVSSRNLHKLRSLRWIMPGIIAGLLPLSPLVLFTLPLAIWTLIVLARPEIRNVLGRSPSESPTPSIPEKELARSDSISDFEFASAFKQVQIPGVGLVAAGFLSLVPTMFLAYHWFAYASETLPGAGGDMLSPIFAITSLTGLPMAGVLILGGMKLRGIQLYGLCVTASVLAMIPCHLGFIIGLPMGIWSLAVLSRPEVQGAFRMRSTMLDESDWPPRIEGDYGD